MKQKVKRLVQIKSEKDIKMNAKLTATFIGEPLNSFRDINNNARLSKKKAMSKSFVKEVSNEVELSLDESFIEKAYGTVRHANKLNENITHSHNTFCSSEKKNCISRNKKDHFKFTDIPSKKVIKQVSKTRNLTTRDYSIAIVEDKLSEARSLASEDIEDLINSKKLVMSKTKFEIANELEYTKSAKLKRAAKFSSISYTEDKLDDDESTNATAKKIDDDYITTIKPKGVRYARQQAPIMSKTSCSPTSLRKKPSTAKKKSMWKY